MTEEYQVTLHSQMGPRQGILTLQRQGVRLTGTLELVGYVNAVQGQVDQDGSLRISHAIQTALSTFECETLLQIQGDQLTGLSRSEPCQMRWEGRRIRQTP